jgi:hypothetical protein
MAFKIQSSAAASLESPESLANDLRPRRVPGPLSHQSDVLRDYHENAQDKHDVALQLPTGSGKTYVGLLIAEWRRRKLRERAVYLCPTNQLVHQVVEQANVLYGIRAVGFTGRQADYAPADKTAYSSADAVAVTSYSSLFNVNPFFQDPQVLVLDDAHAAEQYIASHWSLRIRSGDHPLVFSACLGVLAGLVSSTDLQRLATGGATVWDQTWVDKIASPHLVPRISELVALLDEHVADTDLRFAWRVLRDHVPACQLYVSAREIMLRPFLPPTFTHLPFARARQRVYMSATLGEGGELERLTGRRNIHRLGVPRGWDRHGIGRRLFLFPESALDEEAVDNLRRDLIREAGRALVLTPDDRTAQGVREWVQRELAIPTFDARQIEQSKAPFVEAERAVAVVANRYDGIDFKEEECRLEFVRGLPRAMNLQERFLVTRLGAGVLLDDRIITRIVQAVGRCTRTPTDYATIVVEDDELHTYLLHHDRRAYLHPELQAEMDFGIEQSRGASSADFREYVGLFNAQSNDWQTANDDILRRRDSLSRSPFPGTSSLKAAVTHEIAYQEAIWNGDYLGALEAARRVLSALTEPVVRPYRALWNYLAGTAASLAMDENSTLGTIARQYFAAAAAASHGVPWLHRLARFGDEPATVATQTGSRVETLIERLERQLESLGTANDRRYDRREREIQEGLAQTDPPAFEQAQELLGRLIGYDAGNRESSAAPDPWWIADESLCFVFEDHSAANADSALGADKVRQAAAHPNWVRQELGVPAEAEVLSVIVSPVSAVDRGAVPHLEGLWYWHLDDFRVWANAALVGIRSLRRSFPGAGDLVWRSEARSIFDAYHLSPEGIRTHLRLAREVLDPR